MEKAHKRVKVIPDTLLVVGSPRAHTVIRVVAGASDRGSQEVTPTFTHAAALAPTETPRVGRSTGQTSRQPVSELVDDDASFQVSITIRRSGVPQVHPAATVLTIGWSHEVGVVVTTAILGVGNHSIVLLSSSAEVVLLEVTSHLVEAITIIGVRGSGWQGVILTYR